MYCSVEGINGTWQIYQTCKWDHCGWCVFYHWGFLLGWHYNGECCGPHRQGIVGPITAGKVWMLLVGCDDGVEVWQHWCFTISFGHEIEGVVGLVTAGEVCWIDCCIVLITLVKKVLWTCMNTCCKWRILARTAFVMDLASWSESWDAGDAIVRTHTIGAGAVLAARDTNHWEHLRRSQMGPEMMGQWQRILQWDLMREASLGMSLSIIWKMIRM